MKRLLLAALLTLSLPGFSRIYYTAPTGNDNNAGTITAPFKTLVKAWSMVAAGDTIYLRGGTHAYDHMQYLQAKNGTAGNHIRLWAYPGETPLITRSASYAVINGVDQDLIYCEGNYLHWKNLEIANFSQKPGETPYPAVRFGYTNNSIFENLKYHDNMAAFSIRGASSNNLILNSDFYRNQDPYGSDGAGTDAFDGADGLQMNFVSGTNNTIRGCRAWWNADDGFDVWENNGYVLFDSCWAFWNGYIPGTFNAAGNGSGIKLGQTASLRTTLLRTVQNCIVHRNRSFGVAENAADCRSNIYNNTVSQNGVYGFWFGAWNACVATFVNNISYNNTDDIAAHDVQTTNSWQNGRVVNSADFASTNDTELTSSRAANGSLPVINFLKLVTGSDLINVGTGVGIPFNPSAPDLGAFEFGTTIPNQSPTANAGADKNITLPTITITQTGSGTDPDGSIASYQWTKIAGPATFTIVSPTQATTVINSVIQGTYQFELRVTDNLGATARDTMILTVNAAANIAPTANAGANQTITLPTNTVTVTGTGTDTDGSIATYQWTKIAGPATFTIVSPTQASTAINSLVQGTYQFELRVTDNLGAIGRDTMNVVVNAANIAPTANAGANQTITLPTNTVTVTGTGTDTDGSIASYQWTKIAGPATFTIVASTQASTAINGLVQGNYQFELRVTDNLGAIGRDTMNVVVNAANIAPTANAGANQTITLPASSVTLTGSGTDTDGSISAYTWTKISGPTTFTIVSPATAQTAVNNLVQGTYVFRLTVTDNSGATADAFVTITVNSASNQAPTANAGADQTITLPASTVTVNGSGTDPDGSIASYTWTKISGPATFNIATPNQASTIINNLVQGIYIFSLTVTDNAGATGIDYITITVNTVSNQAPTANAGTNQTITLPASTVTLTGSGTDPDGTIAAYTWTKISGPATFTIVSPAAAQTVVNNLVQGTYVFRLTVTDNSGATADAFVTITVNSASNQAPTANAGADQTITLPANTVTVNGSGTDPDGSIASYTWTKISGPATFNIANPNQASTIINNLVQGVYSFSLTVTDNAGATGIDYITITVNAATNQSPTANAGADRTISLPVNSLTITGTGSDPDGSISFWQWTKISGPATFNIVSPTQASTVINSLVQGVYQFELRVTDNLGAVARDTMIVTVNAAPNQAPTANAGANQIINLPTNTVSVTGSGTDTDGSIASYQWTKIAGPATFNIVSPTQAQTTINTLVQGSYQFELRVTDNLGAIDRDTMSITVNALPNQPPVANAGADVTITLPVNTVTLNGVATDADGSIITYQWTKISGPVTFTIASTSTPQTAVNGMVQGIYVFRLTVTDNNGASATDDVTVTVNAAPNQAPIANAGTDRTITLPTNSLTVTGTGTDTDGSIASYQWTKIAGPATFSITSPTQAQTLISNLIQGTYQFELRVTDNLGAIGRDTMTVTVNIAPNQAPVAAAGIDRSITLPVNSLTLTGSGTDPDGSIASYQWTKIAGPATFTIVSPTQAQTLINNLVQGVYQFELRVTDNLGAIGRDTISVTVNPAANQLPTANAGPNQTITLPTNMVSVTGTGTDPDGTITSYQWTKISGPAAFILSPNQAQTVISNLVQGTYVFRLTVTDNSGATAESFVTITVNSISNQSPSANAGNDQTITLPVNSVTVIGSGTDPDGSVAAYNWTKISGPATGVIVNAGQAQTDINSLTQGTYVFSLTVTDNAGATGVDYVTVTVIGAANLAPTANAGADQTITLPINTVNLTGSANDPDGTIVSYLWTKISGPATFSINSPTQALTSITNLVQGVYVFRLTVTDNSGATADAFVTINVNIAPNQVPVANAGSDQNIILPVNTVSLSGSATDPDGSIVSYLWTKISGPATYTIVSPAQAQTVINNLVQGVYVFRLTATDNSGATADAFVTITVNAAPNLPPVASAGSDRIITLPTNSLTLTGSGSDNDGTIAAYQWNKISGPAQFVILTPTQAQTLVNNLVQGTYQFELRVTDNQGSVGRDTVTVIVNPAAPSNQPPVANAGSNLTITLPVNNVTLFGSGTDTDGLIATYQWSKIAGPATFTIATAAQAQTAINNLVQGTYQFELTVTDNLGASGKDTVTVTVNPAIAVNQAPIVNAGNDQSISLPVNTVNVLGSATDTDGTIAAYQWTKIAGPASFTIVFPTQPQTTINNLMEGTYQFELRATDNLGAIGRDTVTIIVTGAPNLAPVANAGPDRTMTLPTNSITHTGGGTDADGTIASYLWTKIAGPARYTIATPDQVQTLFSDLEEGVYQFELAVTDNRGAIDRDTILVTVKGSGSLLKQVYPNPATDQINIKINGANARTSLVLHIYDSRGVSVHTKVLPAGQSILTETVDLTKFSNGMYIIEVMADGANRSTMKFVKQ